MYTIFDTTLTKNDAPWGKRHQSAAIIRSFDLGFPPEIADRDLELFHVNASKKIMTQKSAAIAGLGNKPRTRFSPGSARRTSDSHRAHGPPISAAVEPASHSGQIKSDGRATTPATDQPTKALHAAANLRCHSAAARCNSSTTSHPPSGESHCRGGSDLGAHFRSPGCPAPPSRARRRGSSATGVSRQGLAQRLPPAAAEGRDEMGIAWRLRWIVE